MSLIKKTQQFPTFGNLFNDFFNDNWSNMPASFNAYQNTNTPKVNILEHNDAFEVQLAAPGMKKDDFKVEINNNILSISCNKEEQHEEKNSPNYTRKEFSYQSFCRSFTLPDTVKHDKIAAQYDKGILKVSIPKREEAKKQPTRLIDIK